MIIFVLVLELRRALDLDAGYLSRILARFDADGLLTRGPDSSWWNPLHTTASATTWSVRPGGSP